MFGGPGKMGRGGGGGAGRRNIQAPPISRPGRPSMGSGPRGRGSAPPTAVDSPATSWMQVDESFSLVRENPLNFGMAIKLAPDLVEEIKRVEAQGGGARIKFDVNANNPNGNVIHVGDKIFKFTWSREPGDLCDIYEERQSGEDGNGLLVESGGTWRKLNVERELDESTKNHVKMRSEEAERKHKSRKAIVLDHQNPSMKNQVKALAAAESNPWRNFKNRKEPPFKKAKLDPPSGGPPKLAYKSSMPTTKISSGSPFSSLPEHVGLASPARSGNLMKGRVDMIDVAPTQNTNIITSLEKEIPSKLPHSIIREKYKNSRNTESKPTDLKSLVISLLQENQSKGMGLKALEKAIGEIMPNSSRQIDPILKQVAVFQSPGRYLLKQGLNKESVKKLLFQSESFPDANGHQPQTLNHLPQEEPIFRMSTPTNNAQQSGELNSTTPPCTIDDPTDKIDALPSPPQRQLSASKASAANTSSDSVSLSDTDSSGSGSGSSSPSHSHSDTGSDDASISSKQASDEDVDIMSDEPPPRPDMAGPHSGRGRGSPLDAGCSSPTRFRRGSFNQPVLGTISSIFGESPENSSPDEPVQSSERRHVDIMEDIVNMDDDDGPGRTGPSVQMQKGLGLEDDGLAGEGLARFSLEGVAGSKSTPITEFDRSKVDILSIGKGSGLHPRDTVARMEDRLPNGRGNMLRREHSDLELGEFREPVEHATAPLPKKQAEMKNSFNEMENKVILSERRSSDPGRGKSENCKISDSAVKSSTWSSHAVVSVSSDGSSKKKPLEKNVDDPMRPHQRSSVIPMEQHQQGWGGHMEPGPQMRNKSRFSDTGLCPDQILEVSDVSRRIPVNSTEQQQQQNDPVRGVGPVSTKVTKKQRPNVTGDSNDRRVDASSTGTGDSGQKKKESSSDKDGLYAKYEKEEPKMKGPIKDASQYKEYVEEYHEKYESYCSLNKILEGYRDEFTKYGKNLETYKDRDMKRYHETLKLMRSSFHQCREKHTRQKKTFIVLYEELKHLKHMIKDYAASYE